MLTVLAVAVDPFVQQLVIPVDCSTALTQDTATLPRTNAFGLSSTTEAMNVLQRWTNQGVSSYKSSIMDDEVGCSTGNCTFAATYTTLGYCSYCVDLPDEITVNASGAPSRRTNQYASEIDNTK